MDLIPQPAAERRSALFGAVRHQRTTRAALGSFKARGIGMRVSRLSGVTGTVTQVHFAHGATTGAWTDYHGFHQHRSHAVTIESLPLILVPALIKALRVPEWADRWRTGHGDPEDFKGAAAAYLYTQCAAPMAATRWTPMPGHEHEEDAPEFTEACWIGDGYVTVSGPGRDAVVKVEFNSLTEFRARRLVETYAALITGRAPA
jgi:hypothetical protein